MMEDWDVKHRPSVCTVWNLKHPPKWKAIENDPYCKRADWVYIGLDSLEDWKRLVQGPAGRRPRERLPGLVGNVYPVADRLQPGG